MTDEAGFTDFVRAHGDDLLRRARLLVPDGMEVQDVLQTALLRLSRRWPVEFPCAYTDPVEPLPTSKCVPVVTTPTT